MSEQYEKLLKKRDKVQEKIRQSELALKKSSYFENRQERKARSRRLIQKGALLEKYFQADQLSVDQTEELLKIFANYVNTKKPDQYKKTPL
ncbi:hypothetical protein [Oenococcus sicerae]|uniref:DUF3847 domain-containing protein n=1 Tax=Oenococcus sicerae TaxID=2203724 RepID=A0AAJ1RC75_9LACO|nr:hypothetical protein [Oenococcus sicerae]MDN6901100.1 hypothetical protein [Oenococcus sicerae]